MNKKPERPHGAVNLRLLAGVAMLLILPLVIFASGPGWSSSASDYAAVNQGQVKNIAASAVAEFDAHLPGGAGDALHALINSWAIPTPQTSNFSAVSLGQLKTVAAMFYDRLITVGYTNQYPWTGSANTPNDNAMANLGQVKNLLVFDLMATDPAHDTDGNGLPDWWELYYFGHTGVNPDGIDDGGTLTNKRQFALGLNPTVNEAANTPSTPRIIYVYDSLGRLISASGGTSGKSSTYVYDSEGNSIGVR